MSSPSSPRKKSSAWVRGGMSSSNSNLPLVQPDYAAPQPPVPASPAKFQTTRQKGSMRIATPENKEAPRPTAMSLFQNRPATPSPPPAPTIVSLNVDCGEGVTVALTLDPSSTVEDALAAVFVKLGQPGDTPGHLMANGVTLAGATPVASLSADAHVSLAKQGRKPQTAFRRSVSNRRASMKRDGGAGMASEVTANHVVLQVVMPDKTQIMLKCMREDTMQAVKQKAVEAFVKDAAKAARLQNRFELQVPGGGAGLKSSSVQAIAVLGDLAYVASRRNNSLTPSFLLVENPVLSNLAKLADKEVGALIGRPLCWTGGDGEVEMFRRVMRLVRRQERISSVTKASLDASLGPLEHTEFMVNVFLPQLMGGVKKTIKTSTVDTGDDLRQRVFDKYYANLEEIKAAGGTHQDYVLKIVGFNDCVDGAEIMLEHEFLMKGVYQGEKPLLKLIPRPPPTPEPDEDEWGDDEDDVTSSVGTVLYSHKQLEERSLPWDQMTVISVWDMTQLLRVKVVGVDGILPREGSKLMQMCDGDALEDASLTFVVSIGVFHGGAPMRDGRESSPVASSTNPRWNEFVQFDGLKLANLARAARLCVTVWAQNPSTKAKTPIGWVNLQLFDYKHELRQGQVALSLWQDDQANPIGTCVPNPAVTAAVLILEMDTYALPIVFPTTSLKDDGGGLGGSTGEGQEENDDGGNVRQLARAIQLLDQDSLYQLSKEECALLWKFRTQVIVAKKGLAKLIVACPYDNFRAVQELHRIVDQWAPLGPLDALELLDARYADSHVRAYAVGRLELFTDSQLQDYLLQLTQVLKYEPYHDSALGRFLIRRALRSSRIGHIFFWFLKGEMHVPEIAERYGLLLEAYLRGVPNFRRELSKQTNMLAKLEDTAKSIKEKGVDPADRLDVMAKGLAKLKFPEPLQLPLSPMFQVSSLNIPKCRFMDSKKLPLWLGFVNADSDGDELKVIFKEGDDLRQDMLTLQMLRIMDRMWRNHGLDMQMSPYGW